MYPSSSSHPHRDIDPRQPHADEGSDQGWFSQAHDGGYSGRDQPSPFPPRRDQQPPNGYPGRDEGNRHPSREGTDRYDAREETYNRYSREEEHRIGLPPPQSGPSQLNLVPASQGRISPGKEHPMTMANPELYRIPPQDPYSRMPHQMTFAQPAPRQRTAIACRYCRRRKIRCSGFESSQDGRCSNCQRFNQECIFTPVSSQTQAFVPAHTQYPQMRQMPGGRGGGRPGYPPAPVQLYGAHGQPLNIQPPPENYRPEGGHPPHHFAGRGSSPGPHPYNYDDSYDNRERGGTGDIHPPILPPPLPRRSSQGDYPAHWNREPASPPILPPPPRGFSPPGSHNQGHTPGYGESAPSSYYPPPTPTRRPSPPSYQGERPSSISPHPTIHPPMWPGPPRPESAGPSTGPNLHPMQLSNIIDQNQPQQRSAHDNEMLNQLKRMI